MDSVGRYQPYAILGEGGLGQVVAARDPLARANVALKIVHRQYLWDDSLVDGIRSAWQAQSELAHPQIVEAHEFLDDRVLVMQLVEGQSLASMLSDSGPLPVDVSIDLMCQIASAVGFAHGRGLLHGDLKPTNILMCSEAESVRAKVGDFGLARLLRGSLARRAVGCHGASTLAYQSPEHLQSPAAVEEHADIYSLGAILYEMLTGSPPFRAQSEYAVLSAIVEQSPIPPSELVGGACAEFDDLVLQALAKDPGDRFESCGELKEALRSRLGITRTHIFSLAAPTVAAPSRDVERAAVLVREARSRLDAGSLMAARGRARKALALDRDCEAAREIILEIEELELGRRASPDVAQLAEAVELIRTFLRDRGPARARRILHQAVATLGSSVEFEQISSEIDRADVELRRSEIGALAARAADRDRRSRITSVVRRVDQLIATRSLLIAAEELAEAIRSDGRVSEFEELATELATSMVAQAERLELANQKGRGRILRDLAADLAAEGGPS